MSEEQKTFIYKVEDIFEDIPNDPNNINMNIPPEIMEQVGLKLGDTIRISYGDQGTLILEKVNKKEDSGKEEKDTNG